MYASEVYQANGNPQFMDDSYSRLQRINAEHNENMRLRNRFLDTNVHYPMASLRQPARLSGHRNIGNYVNPHDAFSMDSLPLNERMGVGNQMLEYRFGLERANEKIKQKHRELLMMREMRMRNPGTYYPGLGEYGSTFEEPPKPSTWEKVKSAVSNNPGKVIAGTTLALGALYYTGGLSAVGSLVSGYLNPKTESAPPDEQPKEHFPLFAPQKKYVKTDREDANEVNQQLIGQYNSKTFSSEFDYEPNAKILEDAMEYNTKVVPASELERLRFKTEKLECQTKQQKLDEYNKEYTSRPSGGFPKDLLEGVGYYLRRPGGCDTARYSDSFAPPDFIRSLDDKWQNKPKPWYIFS